MNRTRASTRVIVGALLGAALGLAGCSASDGGEPGDTSAPAPAPAGSELTGTLTVFAAASLTETFEALATKFEEVNPSLDVVLNYGGSSALAEQINQGAPADVFAAANEKTMQTVVEAGGASDPTIFATNVLELVVPAGNPAGITGLSDLANPDLTIVLCDVAVPCGSAAQQLLDAAGIVAAPDSLEQDVKSVLTKIELGEADAGLVYVTDVQAGGDQVDGIKVPEAADVVNKYPIAVLTAAGNPDAAQAWVDFVLSAAGQAALADAGFGAP
ncbi:molybdate ABC transporter substrate-binding protein [soil metagenome]